MTHPGVGYSEAEDLMLMTEEAVEIQVLRRQGKSIREIARTLDVSRNTVRRYLRVEGLPRYERQTRLSKLDPYKHYIQVSAFAHQHLYLRPLPQGHDSLRPTRSERGRIAASRKTAVRSRHCLRQYQLIAITEGFQIAYSPGSFGVSCHARRERIASR
jgi:transcriptional regulator with XRE-family HTH domain